MRTVLLAVMAILFLFAGGMALRPDRVFAEEAKKTTLFLPSSYEQYLQLESPSDSAINDSYIVIADGSRLYIYDKKTESYTCFRHLMNNEPRSISKLQFSPDGRLYFSDQDTHLFLYDFTSGTARIQDNVPCASFVISGDLLFTASVASNSTTFYAIPHTDGNVDFKCAIKIGEPLSSTSTPRMFVKEGILYCAVNNVVHAYTSLGNESYSYTIHLLAGQTPINELSSVCVYGNELYYTIKGSYDSDGLYRTELDVGCEKLLDGSGFVSLTAYGDCLYAVTGTSVKELRRTENGGFKYTGYEISSRSASLNRLSSGIDTVRGGNLVVTSDRGNKRVSVYNTETQVFTLLPCGEARAVATDGNLIVAAVGENIFLYALGQTEPFYTHNARGNVTGLSIVYGKCYYVTDLGSCGVAAEDGTAVSREAHLTALTSDLYGNLFAADSLNTITKYTEDEFLDENAFGTIVNEGWTLPTGYTSLRADYKGNLYYLLGSGIFRNGNRIATAPSELVYRENALSTSPISLALGFEDNGIYLLYGDYMVYTTEIAIPNLSEIPTEGIFDSVYSSPSREDLVLVDVPSGTTSVLINLNKLQAESQYFSYLSHTRTTGGRGILLGEAGNFSLVALYEAHTYSIALYPTTNCKEAPLVWTDVTPVTRYLSNEVAFSYYPIFSDSLTIKRLPRLSAISLLATVHSEEGLGFDFAYVETEPGVYGYIPLGYLTENGPLSPEADNYTLGYLKENADGVIFRAENGDTIIVKERTKVKIYDGGDGRYLVRIAYNGVEYTAQVTENMLERGNSNSFRTSVIVILCVIMLGIVVTYAYFAPRRKKRK